MPREGAGLASRPSFIRCAVRAIRASAISPRSASSPRWLQNSGAATVGVNPLHALFPQDRERASPYYPSNRRFLDPVYIDVAALEGARANAALAGNAGRVATLQALPNVDYAGVWALKRVILEAAFAGFNDFSERSPDAAACHEFEAFIARGGLALRRFACFEAIGETRPGEPWTLWPAVKGATGFDVGCEPSGAYRGCSYPRKYLAANHSCQRRQLRSSCLNAADL